MSSCVMMQFEKVWGDNWYFVACGIIWHSSKYYYIHKCEKAVGGKERHTVSLCFRIWVDVGFVWNCHNSALPKSDLQGISKAKSDLMSFNFPFQFIWFHKTTHICLFFLLSMLFLSLLHVFKNNTWGIVCALYVMLNRVKSWFRQPLIETLKMRV